MNYKEAKIKAEEIDKGLSFDMLNKTVYVEHCDGTKLELHHASLIYEGEWIMIFTEHNGTFVYHYEDVINVRTISETSGRTSSETDYGKQPVDIHRYSFPDNFMSFFGFKRVEQTEKSKIDGKEDMKTVEVEDLIINTILAFCENAAELGCPRDKDVDMWFRELSYKEALKVVDKMIEIEERYSKLTYSPRINSGALSSQGEVENQDEKEMSEDKVIAMHQIELDLEQDVINGLCDYALREIASDQEALVNYAANKILKQVVDTDGECLKGLDSD